MASQTLRLWSLKQLCMDFKVSSTKQNATFNSIPFLKGQKHLCILLPSTTTSRSRGPCLSALEKWRGAALVSAAYHFVPSVV